MKKYVAGFLFSKDGSLVALVEKTHPEWQKGKLNGIGGKIEAEETPHVAMRREFREEAGVDILQWDLFCRLIGNDFEVYFFSAFSQQVMNIETMEDEKVFICPVEFLHRNLIIPNLKWLVPMAIEKTLSATVIELIPVVEK